MAAHLNFRQSSHQVTNVREGGLLLNESSGVIDFPELLEEYKVMSCTLGKEKEPTNTITVHLHLSRRYEYHLFTTFLPTSLLLILGYVEAGRAKDCKD